MFTYNNQLFFKQNKKHKLQKLKRADNIISIPISRPKLVFKFKLAIIYALSKRY